MELCDQFYNGYITARAYCFWEDIGWLEIHVRFSQQLEALFAHRLLRDIMIDLCICML